MCSFCRKRRSPRQSTLPIYGMPCQKLVSAGLGEGSCCLLLWPRGLLWGKGREWWPVSRTAPARWSHDQARRGEPKSPDQAPCWESWQRRTGRLCRRRRQYISSHGLETLKRGPANGTCWGESVLFCNFSLKWCEHLMCSFSLLRRMPSSQPTIIHPASSRCVGDFSSAVTTKRCWEHSSTRLLVNRPSAFRSDPRSQTVQSYRTNVRSHPDLPLTHMWIFFFLV